MNTQKLSQLLCHLEWLNFMRIGVQQFLERGYRKVSYNNTPDHCWKSWPALAMQNGMICALLFSLMLEIYLKVILQNWAEILGHCFKRIFMLCKSLYVCSTEAKFVPGFVSEFL